MNFLHERYRDLISDNYNSVNNILDSLQNLYQSNIQSTDPLSSELISVEFLEDLKKFSNNELSMYFGQTLRDIKIVLTENSRKHDIVLQYLSPKKLVVTSVSLPYSSQKRVCSSIEEIISGFRLQLESLTGYFYELDMIDKSCTVMEPNNPSYKEDYRRILLDDRTWLHVEVTPDGSATNIYLIGQSEFWQDKLQDGLLKWDHDVDIVTNIMHIFNLTEFPSKKQSTLHLTPEDKSTERPMCSICLCDELPGMPGVPLPLCQNPSCGIYFHRTCLFQWLVACAGGRPPAFGVANGSCPSCLQAIACNEKDS